MYIICWKIVFTSRRLSLRLCVNFSEMIYKMIDLLCGVSLSHNCLPLCCIYRQLHMQLYPGWTARDNYAANAKKKKKKRDKNSDGGIDPSNIDLIYELYLPNDCRFNWCMIYWIICSFLCVSTLQLSNSGTLKIAKKEREAREKRNRYLGRTRSASTKTKTKTSFQSWRTPGMKKWAKVKYKINLQKLISDEHWFLG